MSDTTVIECPRAGFFRRLAAWVYDALLALSIYMVAGAIAFAIFGGLAAAGIIDKGGFEHLIDVKESSILYTILIDGFAVLSVCYFFIFFWTRGGQTLGMRAWRMRLQRLDGELIDKPTGIKRIIYSLLGIGNIWLFVEWQAKLSLQDKLTDCEIIVLPKPVKKK